MGNGRRKETRRGLIRESRDIEWVSCTRRAGVSARKRLPDAYLHVGHESSEAETEVTWWSALAHPCVFEAPPTHLHKSLRQGCFYTGAKLYSDESSMPVEESPKSTVSHAPGCARTDGSDPVRRPFAAPVPAGVAARRGRGGAVVCCTDRRLPSATALPRDAAREAKVAPLLWPNGRASSLSLSTRCPESAMPDEAGRKGTCSGDSAFRPVMAVDAADEVAGRRGC